MLKSYPFPTQRRWGKTNPVKTSVRLSRRKRVLVEASHLQSFWGRDSDTRWQPESLLTAVTSWEAKRKAVQKETSIKYEAGALDCGLIIDILLILIQIDFMGGGMDTARAARRPAGLPAQTTVPPSRRRGSDRIQLRTVLHVLFRNLIFFT